MADDVKPAPDAATATAEPPKKSKDNKPDIKSADGRPMMHIKVYAPFRVYFNDNAFSISAENDTGPFDILPHHKNFMTLVNACVLRIVTEQGEQKIRINKAVMHVKADSVIVFLDV
jgi:F0F1-type ATP synthase epsilon subunit